MLPIVERKLRRSGGGLAVTLPLWWCRSNRLGRGGIVVVSLDGDALKVEPKLKTDIKSGDTGHEEDK